MAYMKLLNGRRHLARLSRGACDPAEDVTTTLCGCTITRVATWSRIDALEGDECPRCADLTFCPSQKHERRHASVWTS